MKVGEVGFFPSSCVLNLWGGGARRGVQAYKKKDPEGPEELELMENMFNCLCAVLPEPQGKDAFLEAEGIQLLILLLRQKMLSRFGALKALSHAVVGPRRAYTAAVFVENLGLKVRQGRAHKCVG